MKEGDLMFCKRVHDHEMKGRERKRTGRGFLKKRNKMFYLFGPTNYDKCNYNVPNMCQ